MRPRHCLGVLRGTRRDFECPMASALARTRTRPQLQRRTNELHTDIRMLQDVNLVNDLDEPNGNRFRIVHRHSLDVDVGGRFGVEPRR